MSELDAANLRIIRQVALPENQTGAAAVIARPGTPMWAMVFEGVNHSNLTRVEAAQASAYPGAYVHLSDQPCVGATMDPSGRYLHVVISDSFSFTLYKVDAHTGTIVGYVAFDAAGVGFSMVATASHLWIAGGFPEADGSLLFFFTSPLKELDHNGVGDGARGALPTFGQFPSVDASAGRVWVGSDANLACFAPESPRALANVMQGPPVPLVRGSFVVIDVATWASAQSGSPVTGLATLTPPAACSAPTR